MSVVQQCSDHDDLWKRLPVCGGRSFPIHAVVAWDGLSTDVVPVVPAMDQQADGYFLNPQPSDTAPDPRATSTGSAVAAGRRRRLRPHDPRRHPPRVGRVPAVLPSTTYGVDLAARYTVAWIDRYLSPAAVRSAASATLADSPKVDRATTDGTSSPGRPAS